MITLLPSKNGLLTLTKDNKFLLSRYRPEKDAERQIPTASPQQFYLLFSAALGYLPRRLLSLGISKSNILIVEPNIKLAEHTLNSEFSECLIQNPSELSSIMEGKLINRLQPQIIALPSFTKAFPQTYHDFENLIRTELKKASENIKVNLYFTKNWFLNLRRNTQWLLEGKSRVLDTKNFPLTNRPILVVASGSSLNNHLASLRKLRSSIPILAVFSAARTLIKNDIQPDALVITDAGPANLLHATHLPTDIPILAGIYAHHATLRSLPNPVLFFNALTELTKTSLEVRYPTVTIEAGMLAQNLTSDIPIFAGFDLSYPLSGSTHSHRNALYELRGHLCNKLFPIDNLMQSFLKRKDLKIEDNRITHSQFLSIRSQVEQLFDGCGFLPGGLNFRTLRPFALRSDLPQFTKPKNLRSALISQARPLKAILPHPVLPDLKDPEIQKRIFLRENLASYFSHEMLDYFEQKLSVR